MKRSIALYVMICAYLLAPSALHAKYNIRDFMHHTPAEYVAMIEKSSTTYTVGEDRDIKPTNLAASASPSQLDPYIYAERNKNGGVTMIVRTPKNELSRLLDAVHSKVGEGNYTEAVKLCRQAIAHHPKFPKNWTLLGLTYYFSGNYADAEKAFLKALELNDIDYQAYGGLAEVYDKMGSKRKALDQITNAYVLAKNNPNILQNLQHILKENNLMIRTGRLSFPFAVHKTSDDKCDVTYRNADSLRWMPLANCLACWQMEPQLNKRSKSREKAQQEDMLMYRECLLNQVYIIRSKVAEGKGLSDHERWLAQVVNDGVLKWLIIWDIMSDRDPIFAAAQPKKDRDAMAQYIKKFVYEKR